MLLNLISEWIDILNLLKEELQEEHYGIEIPQSTKDQSTNQHISISQYWEDSLEPIKQIQRSTPLVFRLKIKDNYFVCYRKDQFSIIWSKFITMLIFGVVILLGCYFSSMNQNLKTINVLLICTTLVLFLIISFLDPGTLSEDEQENFEDQRLYCTVCGYYRLSRTRHCSYCNRCIKNYDHHCMFFGKCIGKRNICFFYLFMIFAMSSIVTGFCSIIYALVSAKTDVNLLK